MLRPYKTFLLFVIFVMKIFCVLKITPALALGRRGTARGFPRRRR